MSKLQIRLDVLQRMRDAIGATARVRVAFSESYYSSVHQALLEADENYDLRLPSHAFFFTFWNAPDVIGLLDDAFVGIEKISGRMLTSEVKKLSGDLSSVVSTVFQFVTLARFVRANMLKAYEPPTAAGSTNVAEALVDLSGQLVLIEAQAKIQEPLAASVDDDAKKVAKLQSKLIAKCSGQLAHADKPVILCQDTDFGLWDHHVDQVITRFITEPSCKSASAIAFAWTYVGEKWRLWLHPDATHPLSAAAQAQLERVLSG